MNGNDAFVVTARTELVPGVVEFELQRSDGGRLPDWTAGAHIDVITEGGLIRQYSLCGDPWDAHRYRIAVALEEAGRGGSRFLYDHLEVGARIGVGGPRNNFQMAPSRVLRFVAGGIGITPILPMIDAAERLGSEWRVLYLGRDRARMAFLDELSAHGARVDVHVSSEAGRADLRGWLGAPADGTQVYACGSTGMLDAVLAATSNWPRAAVRVERFEPEPAGPPARSTPFMVEVPARQLSIEVQPGATVVGALREAGLAVLTSCARGVCGTCEAAVLDGVPDHRDSILNDAERARNDCMFPCVSRARSDRLVLDL